MALDALQCGFCTPGFIVEAAAFHDAWRAARGAATPAREEIARALAGHLCRCGAYDNIFRAVADACSGKYDGDAERSPRIEARQKVTGAAIYTVDVRHEGQLEGVVLRSPHARARVVAIDLEPARAIPGVAAAVSLLDDDRMVHFVGEPVAAVAAVDRKTALAALAAIKVDYEILPGVIGPDAARKADAPILFPKGKGQRYNAGEGGAAPASWSGNVRGPIAAFSLKKKAARGAIEAARAAGDPLLFEGTFRTSVQQHTCLEPHAAVARFDGDELTVHVSTQAVADLKTKIAKTFKLDPGKVRVIAEHIGGGFGSKATLGAETVIAIKLAQAAKAPVRVAFDRHEELSVAGYRPGAEVKVAILPGRDGALKALSLTAYSDAGVAVNSTVAGLARLIYRAAEAKELIDHDVVSNLPPGCAFRAPGGPPMAFALEQAIDEAALRLGTDAIALRKRWDPNPDRQRLYDWAGGLETWRLRARGRAADRPLPARRRRRDGLLALSLAASNEGRARDRGWPSHRCNRRAGHRHRHPQRHRRHGRARVRARSARGRGPHRQFETARGADIRRQPRHRVDRAAAPRRRRQAQGRHRREDRTKAGAGIERAVARTHRRLARSQGRGRARRRQFEDGLRQQFAGQGRRHDRLDLRLHDAPLVRPRDRRRRAELGPGGRGRGRHAARPRARARSAFRRRCRQARGAGSGAQSGRGRGHPGIGLRSLRGA